MVLYVPCFGVSFCTVSPSACLGDIYLSLAEWPPFGKEELLIRSTVCSLYYVYLSICSFGCFEGGALVLIASVPGHCVPSAN